MLTYYPQILCGKLSQILKLPCDLPPPCDFYHHESFYACDFLYTPAIAMNFFVCLFSCTHHYCEIVYRHPPSPWFFLCMQPSMHTYHHYESFCMPLRPLQCSLLFFQSSLFWSKNFLHNSKKLHISKVMEILRDNAKLANNSRTKGKTKENANSSQQCNSN